MNLADTNGLLSVTAGGATVGGSGTTHLTVTPTVAKVDTALGTLMNTDSTLPSDTINLTSTDTRTGVAAPTSIARGTWPMPAAGPTPLS